MREYTTRYADKRPTARDLLAVWREYSHRPLDGVFDRYLAYY
jgi:hypothetical protein